MDVDQVVKEDGAAAVTDGGKDAAAHSPAAEAVPKPVQTELPPNVTDATEEWNLKLVSRNRTHGGP
jgi:hypothetical protein